MHEQCWGMRCVGTARRRAPGIVLWVILGCCRVLMAQPPFVPADPDAAWSFVAKPAAPAAPAAVLLLVEQASDADAEPHVVDVALQKLLREPQDYWIATGTDVVSAKRWAMQQLSRRDGVRKQLALNVAGAEYQKLVDHAVPGSDDEWTLAAQYCWSPAAIAKSAERALLAADRGDWLVAATEWQRQHGDDGARQERLSWLWDQVRTLRTSPTKTSVRHGGEAELRLEQNGQLLLWRTAPSQKLEPAGAILDLPVVGRMRVKDAPLLQSQQVVGQGNWLVVRTDEGLTAIRTETGQTVWKAALQTPRTEWRDVAEEESSTQEAVRTGVLPRLAPEAYSLRSQLGVDGAVSMHREVVFAVERRAVDPVTLRTLVGEVGSTALTAYSLPTGRFLWELGGPSDDGADQVALAGLNVLGPPAVWNDRLVVLVERAGVVELRVISLNDERAPVEEWSQALCLVEDGPATEALKTHGVTPTMVGPLACCLVGNGRLVAVDLLRQQLAWQVVWYEGRNNDLPELLDQDDADGPEMRPGPRGRGGNAFAQTLREQQQRALRARTAQWGLTGGSWYRERCLSHGDLLVLAPRDHDELMCCSVATGEVLWQRPRGDGWLLTALTEDVAMVLGESGVSAVALADGTVRWTLALPDELPCGDGMAASGRVWLPLSSGDVAEIDVARGTIVGRLATPFAGQPFQLTEQGGRLVAHAAHGIYVLGREPAPEAMAGEEYAVRERRLLLDQIRAVTDETALAALKTRVGELGAATEWGHAVLARTGRDASRPLTRDAWLALRENREAPAVIAVDDATLSQARGALFGAWLALALETDVARRVEVMREAMGERRAEVLASSPWLRELVEPGATPPGAVVPPAATMEAKPWNVERRRRERGLTLDRQLLRRLGAEPADERGWSYWREAGNGTVHGVDGTATARRHLIDDVGDTRRSIEGPTNDVVWSTGTRVGVLTRGELVAWGTDKDVSEPLWRMPTLLGSSLQSVLSYQACKEGSNEFGWRKMFALSWDPVDRNSGETPQRAELVSVTEQRLVIAADDGLRAISPDDGRLLWRRRLAWGDNHLATADEDFLTIFDTETEDVQLLSAWDGRLLTALKEKPAGNLVWAQGRRLVVQTELKDRRQWTLFDVVSQTALRTWETPAEGAWTAIDQESACLWNGKELVRLSLLNGQELGRVALQPGHPVTRLTVLRRATADVVLLHRPGEKEDALLQPLLADLEEPLSGTLMVVDRAATKVRWQKRIERASVYGGVTSGPPVVVVAYQRPQRNNRLFGVSPAKWEMLDLATGEELLKDETTERQLSVTFQPDRDANAWEVVVGQTQVQLAPVAPAAR